MFRRRRPPIRFERVFLQTGCSALYPAAFRDVISPRRVGIYSRHRMAKDDGGCSVFIEILSISYPHLGDWHDSHNRLCAGDARRGTSVNTQCLADDTNSNRPVKTSTQMMRECMAKERAKNTGASLDDVKKTCREKIASYNNHRSETIQPPNNP